MHALNKGYMHKNNDSIYDQFESSCILEDGTYVVAGEELFDGDGVGGGAISLPCMHASKKANILMGRNNCFKVKVVSAIIAPWGWLHSTGQRNFSHHLDLV